MSNRLRTLGLILLATAFVIFLPLDRADSAAQIRYQKPPRRCTAEALAALKSIPELKYDCDGRADDNRKSPARQAALKNYLQELESVFANAGWWAVPVPDLNSCAITQEVRPVTDSEFYHQEYSVKIYGDDSTRLIIVSDLCIWYSAGTLNAYILQRAGDRIYATQVLDGYFTRGYPALDIALAQHDGEKLVTVVTNTTDGLRRLSPHTTYAVDGYTTYAVYAIDPRHHRAVPKKIFKDGNTLTHEFRSDSYMFRVGDGSEDEKLAARWRTPEIIRNGKLSPRFTVYTPIKHRLALDTYVWNGKYYAHTR
jgi:hypothetical protein